MNKKSSDCIRSTPFPELCDKFLGSHTFGTLLAEIRLSRRLTQKQVAIAADVDCSYIAALEKGRRSPPPKETIRRLGNAVCASPPERQEMEKAAALFRISKTIQEQSPHIPGASLLIILASSLARLDRQESSALLTALTAIHRVSETHHTRNSPP